MSFRRSKITSESITEKGSGYILNFLVGKTIHTYSDEDRVACFTGSEESILSINNLSAYIDFEGSQSDDLRSVVGSTVGSAIALKDGSLDIRFVSGHRLFIPFDVYEAWDIKSNESIRIVSVAGGNVAIWL